MQIGDNVLAVDQNASKGSWPLGNMVETYPDDSEFVRKALVKKTFAAYFQVGDGSGMPTINVLIFSLFLFVCFLMLRSSVLVMLSW